VGVVAEGVAIQQYRSIPSSMLIESVLSMISRVALDQMVQTAVGDNEHQSISLELSKSVFMTLNTTQEERDGWFIY
jgi:hypothetical protein